MELKYKIKILLENKIKNLFKDYNKKINKEIEEDINITEEFFQHINDDFFSKENKNEIINKLFNLYKIEVIKKASSFIDNKINELLSSFLIQSSKLI